jgi:hypothetical protein
MRPTLPVGAEKDPLVPDDIDVHRRSRQGKIESSIIANIRCELTRDRALDTGHFPWLVQHDG